MPNEIESPDRYIRIPLAAKEVGVSTWTLRRAINAGLIPTYRVGNSRRMVRLHEVVSIIERSRQGGAQ